MKKIVIIGANSFQNPLILKAKEMGYETHVFAWKDGSIGEKTADYFYPISIVEKDEILQECKKIKPDAIVTIASDLANITVQYLSEKLGLPCNSQKTIKCSTNKYEMRKCFHDANISIPKFKEIASKDEITQINFKDFNFPLIVKPTDRSGSRGINKVNNIEELKSVVDESIELSLEKKAIVEEFIVGNEYSCECITYNGKHHFLAITKKYTTGAPHFIETGHIEPSDLTNDQIIKVKKEVFKALDSLEIQFGPSHSEFKITPNGDIKIIEIGSRMGGDCIGSHLVQLSTGFDFLKMTIETALGIAPSINVVSTPKYAGIRFIFNSEDLQVYYRLKKLRPELIYYFSGLENEITDNVVDSSSRKGFYIISCESRDDLVQCMRGCF